MKKKVIFWFLVTACSSIVFFEIYGCKKSSTKRLTQQDLDNTNTVVDLGGTGAVYPDYSIGHGCADKGVDETIRDVYTNLSDKTASIIRGTIFTKKTYLKNSDGTRGELCKTFIMFKKKDGYYSNGGDWEYFDMDYDPDVDYNKHPFGKKGKGKKSSFCADCHTNATGGDFLFLND